MSTTDDVTSKSPCPCGMGKFIVTESSPDHAWARRSQTQYSAKLLCAECSKQYAVVHDPTWEPPWLARKVDIKARDDAERAASKAERDFAASDIAGKVIRHIIAEIDAQHSMAAKYRVMTKYRVADMSLDQFRKKRMSGAAVMEHVSGTTLARIGASINIPGLDKAFFKTQLSRLETLRDAAWSVKVPPVSTGARRTKR